VSQQFGKEKVDELLKDDPALKEAWRLQLLGEVAKQFGREKVRTMLRDEPELKERWNEFVESPEPSTISIESPRPERLWYLAPLLFSFLGGLIAYVAVKDRDKGMAETCLVLGFLVLFAWLLFLFVL
jgi:hypothetical protein